MSAATPGDDRIPADLLIEGATLITMDEERRVLIDGSLAIRGDRIVAVGERTALSRAVKAGIIGELDHRSLN